MLELVPNTLSFYKANPLLHPQDFSKTLVPDLALVVKGYKALCGTVPPESEALKFYFMNHAFSELHQKVSPYEPLGAYSQVAESFAKIGAQGFVRLFYYLLLICTRESRHLHSKSDFHKELEVMFGSEFIKFHHEINGAGSSGAVNKFFEIPPKMQLGKYTEGLAHLFNHGKFSGGYGGKAWGQIAMVLDNMVRGQFSPEIMMDTAYTLAHNNGPIFNKGMMFDMYSKKDILTILDCQRAGQIPQLVFSGKVDSYMDVETKDLFTKIGELFKDTFSGPVDWEQVEKLGAVQSYSSYKAEKPPVKPGEAGYTIQILDNEYAEVVKRAA